MQTKQNKHIHASKESVMLVVDLYELVDVLREVSFGLWIKDIIMMKETTLVVYMSCNKYVKIIASPEVNTIDKKYVKTHSKYGDVLC